MSKKKPNKPQKKSASSSKQQSSKASSFSLATTWAEKYPIYLFVLVFAVLMGAFYLLWTTPAFTKYVFEPVVIANAKIGSFLLNLLGQGTSTEGDTIFSKVFSIGVKRGCDALEPIALFCSAVIAFPNASWRAKLKGIGWGVLALLLINLFRVVSLFLTGVYWNAAFDIMHMQVWQVIFILLAVLFWARWIQTSAPLPEPASKA